MMAAVCEVKEQCKSSLLRLLFAVFETFRYYCKVTKSCIRKFGSVEDVLSDYCKRVSRCVTDSGMAIVQP